MQHTFDTPEPISLYVEIGAGDVDVTAGDVTQTVVEVEGKDADDVLVERNGDQITVVGPKRGIGFFGSGGPDVRVTMPAGSGLATKLGSADLTARGPLGECKLKSGSGEIKAESFTGDAVVDTGSGDVTIGDALGHLRVKCGSGEVRIDHTARSTVVSTGSGDVRLGSTEGTTEVKSGSGEIKVGEAQTDISLTTASGDLVLGTIRRGAVQAKGVSGDVTIGVPAGVPVWTDISCVSGAVRSSLQGAGRPEEGQDHIEIRAKTVSGDIFLEQR